ncbi:MAG TPA: selenide, water dikinase SelD, partial [Bacteroidales bacterium]|nr:selenide, water dikinase SelD [Bacteroidales bacterium]
DAAVFDLEDGSGIISTTDFFTPVTDDAFDFGRIASANAISDIYAMGGRPLLAISVLGWPLEKLPEEEARHVLEGARAICREAGIPLAGGHSIDSLEPFFGLAVTGRVALDRLKRNDTAEAGCLLYLTKPLGVGVLTTAEKKGMLRPEHAHIARDLMVRLNRIGEELGGMKEVQAMTDVTGFGLLGHLLELCEGAGLDAEVSWERLPVIPEALEYAAQGAIPGGTRRNWASYGHKVSGAEGTRRDILCDPQTNGGLLIAVSPAGTSRVEEMLKEHGLEERSIGTMIPGGSFPERVRIS